MKALDIALKDMTRSFRSFFAVVFMFIVPLLVTGMFYFMFGNIANNGEFNLPKTKVVVANLDKGGPKFNINTKNIPGGKKANTMGELIVGILESDEVAKLVELTSVPDAAFARAAVDNQTAQVAIIIPADFSHQFADLNGKAVIEFYQDPTLTIGPGIIRAILNRFTEGMSSVKIAVNVFTDEAPPEKQMYAGEVVQRYLDVSLVEANDPEAKLLEVRAPSNSADQTATQSDNPLLRIVGPIMGGMMIFYAFFTGTSTAQSILKEDEEHTLPRLFTTPTSQTTILSGKFLSVFMTVSVQVTVLLIAGKLIFGIRWGGFPAVLLAAMGIIFSASSFGIFVNSFLKSTKQGSAIFGGVLTVTGMLGMIGVLAMGSSSQKLAETVSLLVPHGWANRGLLEAMNGEPVSSVGLTVLVLLVWSAFFFVIGVFRFNKRYA